MVGFPKSGHKWWTSRQCCNLPCLSLRHYCMMLVAFNSPSSSYSTRIRISFPYRINRIVAGLLQLIQIIMPTSSVSASCQSTLLEPKMSFNYSSTGVTRRNTLLNNSDDRRFVSQTCFDCQCYCVSLHSTYDVSRYWPGNISPEAL